MPLAVANQRRVPALCPSPDGDVFDLRGVDRDAGCVVVVRPDQYVAHVLPLDAHAELADFLGRTLVEAARPQGSGQPAGWPSR